MSVRIAHPLRQHLFLGVLAATLAATQFVAGSEAWATIPTAGHLTIPLECRLADGQWQACRMEVVSIGSEWALVVGGQRWAFRHDGHGSVTMQHGEAPWRPVSSRWVDNNSLCWDGVCARGAIPLD